MTSNLPAEQKTNWVSNEIVRPNDTNAWGEAINKLTDAVPLYTACGDFYTATYTDNIYNLAPLSFQGGDTNQTVSQYVDGMRVVFKCPADNLDSSMVNINSLGNKLIKTIDNVNINTGKLKTGMFIELRYDALNNCFKYIEFSGGATRNIGEIIPSAIPLTDAGLHLLDGELINGGGRYSAFVDYMASLYDTIPIRGYKPNVNIVGSVNNNNGVLSNFSNGNYSKMLNIFNPSSNTWEAVFKITTPGSFGANAWFWGGGITSGAEFQGVSLGIDTSGKTKFYLSSHGSSWDIANGVIGVTALTVNTEYYFKMEFTGASYVVSISTDGETWTVQNTVASSANVYVSAQPACVGGSFYSSTNEQYWKGSIDLKESYININGSRWWTGAEAVKPVFCTEEQWQTSVSTYGVCGKFVYDSVNNTVRLPKITGIVEGTTDLTALGDLVEAGLPQHQHNLDVLYTRHGEAGGGRVVNWCNGDWDITRVDNPLSSKVINSSIYRDDVTTVQPQTIKVLYYIVIATSTKTDIEVDIDEVVTDLNGKADVDLTNCTKPHIVETYVNGSSWYRIYSDGWCEQGGIIRSSNNGSITFLKPFVDTTYILNYQINFSSPNSRTFSYFGYNKTTTGFSHETAGVSNNTWQACGYIN